MSAEAIDLAPLHDSISEALRTATRADETATKALEISTSTRGEVNDLRGSLQRTEIGLVEHRAKSEERHTETLQAIERARASDKELSEKQTVLEGKISNADVGKIAGGVTALLLAVAGAVTLAATQLAPVLPSVIQSRYGQPAVVVVQPAASAAPAPSGSR